MSHGNGLAWVDGTPEALWYPIEIVRMAPPVRDGFEVDGAPPPPPPPLPSPPSEDDFQDHGGDSPASRARHVHTQGATSRGTEEAKSQGSTVTLAPRDPPARRGRFKWLFGPSKGTPIGRCTWAQLRLPAAVQTSEVTNKVEEHGSRPAMCRLSRRPARCCRGKV